LVEKPKSSVLKKDSSLGQKNQKNQKNPSDVPTIAKKSIVKPAPESAYQKPKTKVSPNAIIQQISNDTTRKDE
jgi:hypothetical protein